MDNKIPKKPALANYKDLLANAGAVRESFRKAAPFRLLDAEVRINWRCNAKCEMCGLDDYMEGQDEFRRREMSTQQAVDVLSQLAELGCRRVTISGGEPSLHKGLEEVVDHAVNRLGLWVALNSNGSLLKDQRLRALLESGLGQVTFSLDSPTASVHDRVRRMPGNHARISHCINFIRDHMAQSGRTVQICINAVLMKNTILTMDAFADFYEQAPFDYLTLTPASIGTEWDEWTASDEGLRPSVQDVLTFKSEILPKLRERLPHLHIADPYGAGREEIEENLHVRYEHGLKRCHVPMFHTVVQSNGNVIPCCYAPDNFVMGNAFSAGVGSAWTGDRYHAFRRGCQSGDLFPMCKSCRQYVYLNHAVDGIVAAEDLAQPA